MQDQAYSNAHRIAVTLAGFSADQARVKRLADLLCYYPDQLAEDMCDVKLYISALEDLIKKQVDGDDDEFFKVIQKSIKERRG